CCVICWGHLSSPILKRCFEPPICARARKRERRKIMPELVLAGCTPEPLMNYLKALGVFRLVAEQADSNARAAWHGSSLTLESSLDRISLLDFLLNRYKPTPIAAPWNGGGGFYGGGAAPLDAIAASSSDRFASYRNTILAI